MKTLQHTVVITVPDSHRKDTVVDDFLTQLASVSGGLTIAHAAGIWIDPNGGAQGEAVNVVTAHYQQKDKPAVSAIVDAIVLRLLQLGEQAVLVKDDDFAYVYYQSDKKGLEP